MWDAISEFKVCCRDTVTASNPNATTGGSSVGARRLPAATPPDVNATWLDVDDPPGATCEVSWHRLPRPPGQHALPVDGLPSQVIEGILIQHSA